MDTQATLAALLVVAGHGNYDSEAQREYKAKFTAATLFVATGHENYDPAIQIQYRAKLEGERRQAEQFLKNQLLALNDRQMSKPSNQKETAFFNESNIKEVYQKIIYNRVKVPFEVVGYKKLFAQILNQACKEHALTEQEVTEILDMENRDITSSIRGKLNTLVTKALEKVNKEIKNNGLESEVQLRKSCYRYQYGTWHYIKNLDLEKHFSADDFRAHYDWAQ